MKKRYGKSISREGSLIGFQAWNLGETIELKNWLEWGFERHYFVNKNGVINLFVELQQGEDYYDIVEKKLNEKDFFITLCRDFLYHVNKGKEIFKEKISFKEVIELYDLIAKCFPATSIFDLISNYPEITLDENVIKKIINIRKETGEFLYELENRLMESVPEIFPEIKNFEDVILIQEFANKKFPLVEELEKRKQHYILFSHFLETDKSFEELSKEHEFEIIEDKTDDKITGMVVVEGNVTGRVKLIFKQEDVAKVNYGDILVAPMTTPDHIIAMDKAGAFITDEGGITCHAAIIAREFGKPCIVGTGNATKILKDNDLVFVDGRNGVVKKIE
ncbi:MAG: hypothetical protein KJ646_05215 [Nanoarchaeota archaeon]|nr:hypothetical protein [Nanoarchaeota archaeon]MBU4116937.1 hypothetical protein [Nanoarchaeota archaeon]